MGRFHTQDAYAEKYLDFSPYQYAANNPVKFIDVNGDSIWIEGISDALVDKPELLNSYVDVLSSEFDGKVSIETYEDKKGLWFNVKPK